MKRSLRNDQGFSLIEMLVAMSVGSAVMLLAMMLMNRSMQLSTAASNKFQQSATLARLASGLRDDALQADRILLVSDQELQFQLPDGRVVTWQLSPADHAVHRSLRNSDQVTLGREGYEFNQSVFIEIKNIPNVESRQLVQIVVTEVTGIDRQPRRLERLIEVKSREGDANQEQLGS